MSGLREALDARLDAGETGTVEVSTNDASATVDVVAVGPLGARVRRIEVRGERGGVEQVAASLPHDLRALPEPIEAVEVDASLGGAILRTPPEAMEQGEFFEVEVRGDSVAIDRYRRQPGGRESIDYDLTRKQLGRLVDALEHPRRD